MFCGWQLKENDCSKSLRIYLEPSRKNTMKVALLITFLLSWHLQIFLIFVGAEVSKNPRIIWNPVPYGKPEPNCTWNRMECHCLPESSTSVPPKPPLGLWDLLQEGSDFLRNYTFRDEAILQLGNTGAGKTTAAKMMAAELCELHAVVHPSNTSLIIVDEEDKIGHSTESKTLLPELFLRPGDEDFHTTTSFYDFPGFSDTRGHVHDIAANYFMTEVIRKVGGVKMLFFAIYSAIKESRTEFNMLVEHSVTFVKDIAKFPESYALVITKVESCDRFGCAEDEAIVNEIVTFLKDYNNTLHKDLENPEKDAEMTKKKILFTQTFLHTDDNNSYDKIWFIQTPDQCGPLCESELMVDTSRNLTEMYRKLNFATAENSFFGFTLKAETKLEIEKTYTPEINDIITKAISQVTEDLERVYLGELEHHDFGLSSFMEKLMRHNDTLVTVLNEINKMDEFSSSPSIFAGKLKTYWESVGLKLPKEFEELLNQQQTYLEFFDTAAGQQRRRIGDWQKPVLQFYDSFSVLYDWYEFCLAVEITTRNYPFQSTKPTLPRNLTDWLSFVEDHDIVPVSARIKEISSKIGHERFSILENLLAFALDIPKMDCQAEPGTLIVHGNFIVLSNFSSAITGSVKGCESANQINFLVAHTLFLDLDIEHIPKQTDVVILSPNLQLEKSLSWKISLAGPAGAAHQPPTAGVGTAGCAGKPGGTSGASFVVSSNVRTSKQADTLTITVITSGGDGGNGQNGGSGVVGTSYNDAVFWGGCKWGTKPTRCNRGLGQYIECVHPGFPGGTGGVGRDGGSGGQGGYAASNTFVLFYNNEENVDIKKQAKSGATGQGGEGGKGAVGGKSGRGYKCNRGQTHCDMVSIAEGKQGADGTAGRSSSCRVNPSPARTISESSAILHYRTLFLNLTHSTTVEFLTMLDSSLETKPYINLEALAEESLMLETIQSNNIVNPERLKQLYSSLVQRLEIYSNDHFGVSSKEDQKVITMLLTTAFGNLMRLRSPLGLGIVVDVSSYLGIAVRQIEELQKLEENEQYRDAVSRNIQEEKQKFQKSLSEKITQAVGFIEDIVTPAMEEAEKEVDVGLELLQKQLVDLIEDAELSLEEAKKQLRQAEREKKMHRFFKVFSVLSGVAAAFYPPAASFNKMVNGLKDKYAGSGDKVAMLEELVKESEAMLKDLENKRDEFEKEFAPIVTNLLTYLKNISLNLTSGGDVSAAELGIAKWQVLGKLKDCKFQLDGFEDETFTVQPLVNAFTRIQDVMTISIDMYELIDHYLETKSLAEYIAQMQSALLGPVNVTDTKFGHTLVNFNRKLRENLLDSEVNKAIHAFKQWVFPFAKFYMIPSVSELTKEKGLEIVGSGQREQVKYLQYELERYKSMTVGDMDTSIILTNFSSGLTSSKPFFTWKNAKWGAEMASLLNGDLVHMDADVTLQGLKGWEAIKFRVIEINLKLNDATPEMQNELDELLPYFGVSLTHSGVSYYRFLQDYFVMTGVNQTIIYNFERDTNGNRLGTNLIYEKFKKGDFLLSPFTVWSIQLKQVVPVNKRGDQIRKDVSFKDLEKFLPYVDVELQGTGTYVKGEEALQAAGGDMQLDKHYNRDRRLRSGFIF